MSNGNKKITAFRNTYGSYTPSSPLPPVPPFPCDLNSLCSADNRVCDRHRSVLFVKEVATGETFEIPYGKWESWLWYKQRINDRKEIPLDEIRLIFAGAEPNDLSRHSGLQSQSTIHMLQQMGQTECKPSAQQRGDAAHIRQHDENHNMQTANVQERRTCNEIIHGKEMVHEPKYDDFLKEQKEKRGL